MTPQEAAQEEVQSNVIYMAEFLMRRRNQTVTEANTMFAKAQTPTHVKTPLLAS